MTIKISNIKHSWRFQIADVHKSILGADFLQVNNLLVDLTNKRLVRLQDLLIINSVVKKFPGNICNIARASTSSNEFTRLLQEQPELTTPTFSLDSAPKHRVKHYTVTNGPPVHAQAQRLSPEKLKVAKDEFKTLQNLGII